MNKRKSYVIISLFFALVAIFPIQVEAKNIDSYINYLTIKNMTPETENSSTDTSETGTKISECESILGDVNDESSVAWLLQKILNYIKILGPTIAIIMGSLDFAKAIIASDEESMKKSQSKFVKRLIAAVILFFLPLLVSILLGIFNFTTNNATCGLK